MAASVDFRRAGQAGELWPVLLLLALVAVPTIAVLWFTGVALENQQLATQQRLTDAYRVHLRNVRDDIDSGWLALLRQCDELVQTAKSPQEAFQRAVSDKLADSLIIYDDADVEAYPNSLTYSNNEETGPDWFRAKELENFSSQPLAAHDVYEEIASTTKSERERIAAIQAQLRCLLDANEDNRAASLVDDLLLSGAFDALEDPHAKSIAIYIQLMAFERLESSSGAAEIRRRLVDWTKNYSDPFVAAPQRLFVMKQLAKSDASVVDSRMLEAESIAASLVTVTTRQPETKVAYSSDQAAVSYVLCPSRSCLVAFKPDTLRSKMLNYASATMTPLAGADLHVLSPGSEPDNRFFLSSSAGLHFPGWRLAFALRDAQAIEASAVERNRLLWTGSLVVLSTSILAFFSVRAFRRQLRLANFKNNLVGTVSHELKTPLSSMRLLVETLLDEEQFDEQTTREYLQLIAKENQRLSRVIESFLTFSRIERGALAFDVQPLDARKIIELAIEAAGDRLNSDECDLTISIEENLPAIRGDEDGLVTVLLNLLDNAYKYSRPIREIKVSAKKSPRGVSIAVSDNGIGVSRSAKRRIFQRFYQVDRGLSRIGDGCGLGLSIVESIVMAHGGTIEVESELGSGSQFIVTLPEAYHAP